MNIPRTEIYVRPDCTALVVSTLIPSAILDNYLNVCYNDLSVTLVVLNIIGFDYPRNDGQIEKFHYFKYNLYFFGISGLVNMHFEKGFEFFLPKHFQNGLKCVPCNFVLQIVVTDRQRSNIGIQDSEKKIHKYFLTKVVGLF